MAFFPCILKSLGEGKSEEKKLITAYAFLCRAVRLPENEFEQVPNEMLEEAVAIMTTSFFKCFDETSGTYNAHIVLCHLQFIRQNWDFNKHSAYAFEALYAEMRNSFVPGTCKCLLFNFRY